MDWQQKAEALHALASISIGFRKPGDWYVHQDVDVKNGSILSTRYGNSTTPEGAIINHWELLTSVKLPSYIVGRIDADGKRKAVVWNGFMWKNVDESGKTKAA